MEYIMSDKIFVQIAAYRDPELLPTIRDCIKRADNPEDLVFAIAWQRAKEDTWDTLEEYKNDSRFKIIEIDYKEAQGTCWARHLLNEAYDGEKYTLQLDSHHRFVRGWDTKCKKMMLDLIEEGYSKPLLTAYVPSYDPDNDPASRAKEVWKLTFDRFTPEGVVFMLPTGVDDIDIYKLPIPTRFFSAHFMFTFGQFIKDVPYDPNLYFHGEEITMAVRAYTHGYDLFIPNEIICWHEYTRKKRVRHWDEKDNGWEKRNDASLKRSKQLLQVDGDKANYDFGIYGFGTERTKQDYEEYAGIRFEDRAVQQYTLEHYDPPNPIYRNEIARQKSYKNIFKHCLDVWKESITETDCDFWVVAFKDEKDNDMYREDANKYEIENIVNNPETLDGDFYNIWRQFDTKKRPHKWIVWPHSASKGWLDPIENTIPDI
jgi:hypothetical protein